MSRRNYSRASSRAYQGTCAVCGDVFLTGYPYTLYCGPECRQEAARARMRDRQPLLPARALRQVVEPTREDPVATGGMEVRAWNGVPIHRRPDGWVNATAMAQACGKRWNDYIRLDRTREYVSALKQALEAEIPCGTTGCWGSAGNPADPSDAMVIQSITTGPNDQRGTYIHPRLAIDFSRWLRAAFAVWMDGWFLGTFTPQRTATAPHHHQPTTPGITVAAPTEREARELWQAAVEAETTRALRLTLGVTGRTDAGMRPRVRGGSCPVELTNPWGQRCPPLLHLTQPVIYEYSNRLGSTNEGPASRAAGLHPCNRNRCLSSGVQ